MQPETRTTPSVTPVGWAAGPGNARAGEAARRRCEATRTDENTRCREETAGSAASLGNARQPRPDHRHPPAGLPCVLAAAAAELRAVRRRWRRPRPARLLGTALLAALTGVVTAAAGAAVAALVDEPARIAVWTAATTALAIAAGAAWPRAERALFRLLRPPRRD